MLKLDYTDNYLLVFSYTLGTDIVFLAGHELLPTTQSFLTFSVFTEELGSNHLATC